EDCSRYGDARRRLKV
ncbi:unnamed protein product, partial [Oikopleura dioica]